MGLEGVSSDGGSLLAAPGLAQKLEDEGTNAENANVLNLFLDNVAVSGGAPAPITDNVGSINVTSASIVFNGNLSRERYGRAAVQDNVTLESDRRGLLLNDNQTNTQKAQSILGALEFSNGLSAVQSMSDADVTGTNLPSNIDGFNRRPTSMYQNAGVLSGPKRDVLMPTFTGQTEPEFVDALVSQAGGDTTVFTTFGDVVADQPLMQSIAADGAASGMLSAHPNGAPAMAGSQTAMTEMAASQTAMEKVAVSQTAMEEVAASQTAADAVASSGTAASVIEAASSSSSNSVPSNDNAPLYIADLSGAGGGGGDGINSINGSDGGDTTFHESTAGGGAGGRSGSGEAASGNGVSAPPDVAINTITGGGSSGGNGRDAENGGDGGFLKALIINTEREPLSLSLGNGGAGGAISGSDPGQDGSATIFTPNVF